MIEKQKEGIFIKNKGFSHLSYQEVNFYLTGNLETLNLEGWEKVDDDPNWLSKTFILRDLEP